MSGLKLDLNPVSCRGWGQGCDGPRYPSGEGIQGQGMHRPPPGRLLAILVQPFADSLSLAAATRHPLYGTLTSIYEESEQNRTVFSTMSNGKMYKPGKVSAKNLDIIDTWHCGLEMKLQPLTVLDLN